MDPFHIIIMYAFCWFRLVFEPLPAHVQQAIVESAASLPESADPVAGGGALETRTSTSGNIFSLSQMKVNRMLRCFLLLLIYVCSQQLGETHPVCYGLLVCLSTVQQNWNYCLLVLIHLSLQVSYSFSHSVHSEETVLESLVTF